MANNKLIKGFLEYALGSGVLLLLGFLSSPIITRLFDPSEFGKFSMFLLFSNIVSIIIVMGMDQSFVRYFYLEENNQNVLLRQTLKYPIIATGLFTILCLIFGTSLSKALFNEYNVLAISFIIINNYIMIFNKFSLLVIRMQQKGKLYSLVQIVQKVVNICIILILVTMTSHSYLILVASLVLSNMIVTLISIRLSNETWKVKNKSIKLKTKDHELLKFGLPLLFTFLITWLFQSIDRLFIKQYSDYTELGLYSAAFSIIALLNAVQNAFTTFWVPIAYEHYEKNKEDRQFFVNINLIVTFTMFFIGILLVLFKDGIVYLLGKEYREASSIMPFLIFMPVMYTISETTVLGINFMKKSKYHIYIALASAIVNIIGNFILVPKYGATGAAISTGLAYIFFFGIRTYISNKLYEVKFHIKKIYIMSGILLFYSWYATFHQFGIVYSLYGLICLGLLFVIFRKEVFLIIKYIKKSRKNKVQEDEITSRDCI